MDAGMYRETDLEVRATDRGKLHLKQNRSWDYQHMMRTHMIQAMYFEQRLYLDLQDHSTVQLV